MGKAVLVTGFGPFMEHSTNASWEAVKDLKEIGLDMEGVDLVIKDMPVVYSKTTELVPQLWDEFKPALVIHVGVHGHASTILLEERAVNSNHLMPDNDHQCPEGFVCVKDGDDRLQCKLNLDAVRQRCAEQAAHTDLKVVFEKSQDAGNYLCNFSYYLSLSLDRAPSLFVHVPPLGRPFSCRELALALRLIVRCCLEASDPTVAAAPVSASATESA